MAEKRIKRPRDIMELAHLIGEIATQQRSDKQDDGKDPKAVERGQKGGLKGGKARAKALTPKNGQR